MITDKTSPVLINNDDERFFGPGPAELLYGVEKYGSLLGSSKAMGMSYSKASMIIRRAEKSLGIQLLDSTTGGIGGGGSRLTPEASLFLRAYSDYTKHLKIVSRLSFSDYISPVIDSHKAIQDVGIILLASGHSERFGEDKLTYRVCGKALIEYILDTLKTLTSFTDIIVSTTDSAIVSAAQKYGINSKLHNGTYLSDSIRNGLSGLPDKQAYMFIQGDQPLLTVSSILELSKVWSVSKGSIVRLGYKDTKGSPVVFPKKYKENLEALIGETGGSTIIREHLTNTTICEASAPWELWDCDTKSDLKFIEDIISMR